jgi:uncharacterized membrane protein YkoI
MSSIRTKLATIAAISAAAVGGATMADAATTSTAATASSAAASTSQAQPAHDPSKAGHQANGKTEALLTGDTAASVKAATLKKVAGTVERVETNVDSSAPYEAHVRKSDGTEVEVRSTAPST